MIDEHELELGAAEARESGVLGERNAAKLRMRVVDDVGGHLERRLGGLAGGCRIAGERKQHAHFDRIGGARHAHARCQTCRRRARACENGAAINAAFCHMVLPARPAGRILFSSFCPRPPLRVREPPDSFRRARAN